MFLSLTQYLGDSLANFSAKTLTLRLYDEVIKLIEMCNNNIRSNVQSIMG